MDASLLSLGAHLGDQTVQGRRSPHEASKSINFLECRMIRLALQVFASQLQNVHVLVYTDSMMARAYVNRQGGTRSKNLQGKAHRLFPWAEQHLASIRAEHNMGTNNILADWLSHTEIDQTEWSFHAQVFRTLDRRFGPLTMDLFACHLNHLLPRFLTGGDVHRQRE